MRSRVLFILMWVLLVACVTWAQTPPTPQTFIPTAPCRVLDTRQPSGAFGAPALVGGTVRTVTIPDNPTCWVPTSATSYALNVTVVPATQLGYVTVWPTGELQPTVSTLNSLDGRTKAVAAIVKGGTNGGIDVFTTDNTEAIVDIVGYFVGPGNPNALYYYPMDTYCEVINTNYPPTTNGLGGPYLQAGISRTFQLRGTQNCHIPYGAQAYSLNVTATPLNGQALHYVTVWPADHAQPSTSTLNDPVGIGISNAAIVGADPGGISIYATNDTNVQVYLNGFFGPAGLDGRDHPDLAVQSRGQQSGYALYSFNPCRGYDTRPNSFINRMDINFQHQGDCQTTLPVINSHIPDIQAYVLNATVVPDAGIGYFPIWPYGQQMPIFSALSSTDGEITSNMAIVPTGKGGGISAYSSASTDLVYDISGYFASPNLVILTTSIPDITLGVPYGPLTIQARGGAPFDLGNGPQYKWSAKGLPANLTIDKNTGTISGCPVPLPEMAASSNSITVKVQDAWWSDQFDSLTYSPNIKSLPSLEIATDHLPPASRQVYYSTTLAASGGYGNYTRSLAPHSQLPMGLTLTPDGVISGEYTGQNAGYFHFTVQVSDQECPTAITVSQSLTLHIY